MTKSWLQFAMDGGGTSDVSTHKVSFKQKRVRGCYIHPQNRHFGICAVFSKAHKYNNTDNNKR